MSTRFIPGGSWEPGPPVLEAQQELLINTLRRAGRAPMSYAELRRAGIELPASVVSELELAGVPIERCYGGTHGERHMVGVRLAIPEPEAEPEPSPTVTSEPAPAALEPPSGWSPVRVYRATAASGLAEALWAPLTSLGSAAGRAGRSLRSANPRLLAPIALGVAVVIVAVIVLTGLSGDPVRTRSAAAPRANAKPRLAAKTTPTTHTSTTATGPARSSTAPAPPTPVSPALATQLEAQGHALLAGGEYVSAIPVLRRALAATGEQTNACLEPASESCLTYAYALYDLGRALALSGNSAAAVPILEARLQIDNQRPIVAAELQLARDRAA